MRREKKEVKKLHVKIMAFLSFFLNQKAVVTHSFEFNRVDGRKEIKLYELNDESEVAHGLLLKWKYSLWLQSHCQKRFKNERAQKTKKCCGLMQIAQNIAAVNIKSSTYQNCKECQAY
jgi:hypothetical protein